MASSSQKKSTSGKKRGSSSASRSKKAAPQPRPIRREVWGVVLLVLTLCTLVSYLGISALFIDWLAVLLKGTGWQDRPCCWQPAFC